MPKNAKKSFFTNYGGDMASFGQGVATPMNITISLMVMS